MALPSLQSDEIMQNRKSDERPIDEPFRIENLLALVRRASIDLLTYYANIPPVKRNLNVARSN